MARCVRPRPTAREAEVLALAWIGRLDRRIAERLAISCRAVEKHLQRCYAKLGVARPAREDGRSLLRSARAPLVRARASGVVLAALTPHALVVRASLRRGNDARERQRRTASAFPRPLS